MICPVTQNDCNHGCAGKCFYLSASQPDPMPQDVAAPTLEQMFNWLLNNQHQILYLTKNEDHRTNYVTAKKWIEEEAPEHFEGCPQDELQKMKDADTIWTLQFYPDTPIGFYVFHGATMDSVIRQAMEANYE